MKPREHLAFENPREKIVRQIRRVASAVTPGMIRRDDASERLENRRIIRLAQRRQRRLRRRIIPLRRENDAPVRGVKIGGHGFCFSQRRGGSNLCPVRDKMLVENAITIEQPRPVATRCVVIRSYLVPTGQWYRVWFLFSTNILSLTGQ